MLVTLIVSMVIALLPGCRDAPTAPDVVGENPVATPPAAPPKPVDPPPPPAEPAEALLDRLEKSAADLRSFTGDVIYEKVDSILGRREIRTGNVIYRAGEAGKDKRFAVLFNSTIVGRTKRDELKHFVFDGRWLAEIDHAGKQFIKREIVPPGKALDPLKLGEGPFPLPVGQPKAEVLARFDVTKAELPRDGRLADLTNVEGLLLVPKPKTKEAEDIAKVVIFYDKATLLPVGIHLVELNGDEKTVRLSNLQRNMELSEAQQAKLSIEEPDPREWRIDVRPWSQ